MNGIHPKANAAAICALFVAILATGCRSTSSGVNNPFLAPDRVAPPSTRVLAPGQAQPYYQGDPLPVMQSATQRPNPLLTSDSTATRTATGKTLAWNSPGPTPQPANAAAQPAPIASWPPLAQSPSPILSAPENAVSVPADTASLRFPMQQPAMQPVPTTQIASGLSHQGQSQINAATGPSQGVMLASYNAPASNAAPVAAPANANSPWRRPQYTGIPPSTDYRQQASAVPAMSPQSNMLIAPPYPTAQAAITMPTNSMAVDLRAVASPPQPGDPMPRVRVPGYDTPEIASEDGFRSRASMR
jgi:hypothetical protein